MRIEKTEAEKLTAKLVSFSSMTGTPQVLACAEYIKQWFEEQNIPAEIVLYHQVPNVVAKIGKGGGKRLLLDGHFDVVPPGEEKEWNSDPFCTVSRDGYIYGRGVGDMKSGIAAAMIAMRELKKKEEQLEGEIVFYGVGDEETGSINGTIALLNQYDNVFDGAIVPEPTDFCIERAQRGLRWIEVHVKGKACHAGRPHVGKNAIEQASKIIQALKQISYNAYEEIFEEGLKAPSLSVNRISGGIKNNVVAEECTFLIDRRMLPGETVEQVLSQIQQTVEGVLEEGFTYSWELVNNGWDPFITPQEDPIVKSVEEAYREITEKEPVIRGKGGCTDASHIYNAGIPVVILGPGSANESHTANEKCDISRIALTAEIIIQSAEKFLKQNIQEGGC